MTYGNEAADRIRHGKKTKPKPKPTKTTTTRRRRETELDPRLRPDEKGPR